MNETVGKTKKAANMNCGEILTNGDPGTIAGLCKDGTQCRNRGTYVLMHDKFAIYYCGHHEQEAQEVLEKLEKELGTNDKEEK